MRFRHADTQIVRFKTKSGQLTVEKKGNLFEMDFPAYKLRPVPVTDEMAKAIGARPEKAFMGRDLLCVMDSEETVRQLRPDMHKLLGLDGLLLQVTARGTDYDCVSRSFAPKLNVTEDPVCGSGHCHIMPYWAQEMNKTELVAYQDVYKRQHVHKPRRMRSAATLGQIQNTRCLVFANTKLFYKFIGGIVKTIVIYEAIRSCIVGRIDVYALYLFSIGLQ